MILTARSAAGETLAGNPYSDWQWNGFSRSSWVSVYLNNSSATTSSALLGVTSLTNVAANPVASAASSTATGDNTSLSGAVYYDANGGGGRTSSDWGIPDATVLLTLKGSSAPPLVAITAADGSYTFSGLTTGDYTIALLTPSNDPEAPSVGTITDASGNNVTTGLGAASGLDSIADVSMNSGDTGVNYDFPQLAYPFQLLSKRMLLNTSPGVQHTTPAPPPVPVPEPSSLVLLAVAGLILGGLRRRWRRCND